MLSGMVFVATSLIIINWFIQGLSINKISNSLIEETPIVDVVEGELVNIEIPPEVIDQPEPEKHEEYSNKNTLYWKYLNTPLSSVDFTSLTKENKDTVGWIIVNNTNVNYPVVQTNDNDYYLSHDFNKKRNSAGWVFADFRDDFDNLSRNTVIYAHGRKDKVMFGSLTNTLNKKWYTNLDNQIIQLSTLKYNTMWQIFAVYKVEAESYYITTDFSSDESYEEFLSTMKSRSIYNFGVDVDKNDKVLTLSTCYNDNGIRLVVQAKLVKIQER
jgi:sortase B